MTLKIDDGRQPRLVAKLEIDFGDPVAGAQDAIQVPEGAIVVGGFVSVLTAFNSTTNTLKLGDASDDDRLTATPIDLKTVATTQLTLTGYRYSVEQFLKATYASTGTAASAGKARIVLEYIRDKRSLSTQG